MSSDAGSLGPRALRQANLRLNPGSTVYSEHCAGTLISPLQVSTLGKNQMPTNRGMDG